MESRAPFTLRSKDSGVEFEVEGEVIVGRSAECGLVISEGEVSRRHAKLTVSAAGLCVEDLGSSNGTFVNERRIQAATSLKRGDVLRFDRVAYEVTGPAPAEPPVDQSDRTIVHVPAVAMPPTPAPRTPGSWVDPRAPKDGTSVMTDEDRRKLVDEISAAGSGTSEAEAPQLRIMSGRQKGKVIPLAPAQSPAEQRWTIGSDPLRDIMLDDDGVSRQHAEITTANGRWQVVDQMSANGTFVDDKKVLKGVLRSGNRIRFGTVEVVVEGLGAGTRRTGGGRRTRLAWLIVAAIVLLAVVAGAFLALR